MARFANVRKVVCILALLVMVNLTCAASLEVFLRWGQIAGGASWSGSCNECSSVVNNCYFDSHDSPPVNLNVFASTATDSCTVHIQSAAAAMKSSNATWTVQDVSAFNISIEASINFQSFNIWSTAPVTLRGIGASSSNVVSGNLNFRSSSSSATLTIDSVRFENAFLTAVPWNSPPSGPFVTVKSSSITTDQNSSSFLQIGTDDPATPGSSVTIDGCTLNINTSTTGCLVNFLASVKSPQIVFSSTNTIAPASLPLVRTARSLAVVVSDASLLASAGPAPFDALEISSLAMSSGSVLELVPPPHDGASTASPLSQQVNYLDLDSTSIVKGYSLISTSTGKTSYVRLGRNSQLIDCSVNIAPSSLFSVTSPASIILNSPSPTFSVNGGTIQMSPSSTLELSLRPPSLGPTPPHFSTTTSQFGLSDSSAPCLVVARQYPLVLADGATISTFCSLSLPAGLQSTGIANIKGKTDRYGNPTADLGLFANATYDTTINLDTFRIVSITLDSAASAGQYAVRTTAPSTYHFKERPQHIRINWTSTMPLPVAGKKYYLFNSTGSVYDDTTPSYMLESDIYAFNITATPIDSSGSQFWFEYAGPPLDQPQSPPSSPEPHSTPPTELFSCNSARQCFVNTSIVQSTVILPPNSAITVEGNLTASSLVFGGLDSSVTVKGCVSASLTSITVDLSPDDLTKLKNSKDNKLSVPLLTIDSPDGCESSLQLSQVAISAKTKDAGCKRVKVAKQTSSNSHVLSAIFTLDNSKCNLWWIILVAVLGGVILVVVIVLVLLVLFVPSVREKIRPYSKRMHSKGALPQ